jgi:hypothetical protein
MNRMSRKWLWLPLMLLFPLLAGAESVEWGGILPEGRTQNLRLQVGAVLEFEGVVTETTRSVYELTGEADSRALAESYGTSDFDMEGPFGAIGLSLDMAWRFFRLQVDSTFLAPSVSTTAKRDYYLSVGDDITFNGVGYDRLMIPEGTPFSADLFGNITELVFSFVPLGFRIGESVVVNPMLSAGVLLFGGRYDIEAGESTEVITYLNPPEQFVMGGSASGFVGMGAPQWGPGVEVRIGPPGGVNVDLQAHYLMMTYNGSTAFLTTADHRDKDLDFDHTNLRLQGQVEFPTRRGAWNLGVMVQFIDSDGLISSSATDPDEIRAKRERFDKEFIFKVQSVYATVGLSF